MSEAEAANDDTLRPRSFYFDWPVSDSTFQHCCKHMHYVLVFNCDIHKSPFECHDNNFVYNEVYDEYGVIVRMLERHYTLLRFCPFCGAKLPRSREEDWKRELAALGYDLFSDEACELMDRTNSYTQAWRAIGVPERYLTSAWRSSTGA